MSADPNENPNDAIAEKNPDDALAQKSGRQEAPRFGSIIGLIGVVSLWLRIRRISSPPTYYFDEIYFSQTARHFRHWTMRAYSPWGFEQDQIPYEWTHPPLGKLLHALAMVVCGENSFGWRIGSAFASAGIIVLAAFFARDVTGSARVGILTALVLALEGVLLVIGRIGLVDSYLTFFILLSAWLYFRATRMKKSRLLEIAAGLAWGCAIATKWSASFVLVALTVDALFLRARTGDASTDVSIASRVRPIVIMFAVGTCVYIASYAQSFALGYGAADLVATHVEMWRFHTGPHPPHPYASPAWKWVLNLRPVWLHNPEAPYGKVASIYLLGNSVVLLAGFASALFELRRAASWIASRSAPLAGTAANGAAFVLVFYFAGWVPYLLSPRYHMLYHYAPAIPFLGVLLATALDRLLASKSLAARRIACGTLAAAALWFIVFYPHYTGIAVPEAFANRVYFALASWK